MQLGYVSKRSAAIVHFLQPYSSSNCVQCHLNLGIQPQLSGTSTMDGESQGAGPDLFPLWLITHSLFGFFITCMLHCQIYDGYSPDISTWRHLAEHSAGQGAEPCHGGAALMELAQFRQGYHETSEGWLPSAPPSTPHELLQLDLPFQISADKMKFTEER